MRYDIDIILFSDHQSVLEYAEEKGVVISEARGEARGMEKAARVTLREGDSVVRITGLPKKQIMVLR